MPLKKLFLKKNPLSVLPKSFGELKGLTLDLDWLDYIADVDDILFICSQASQQVNFLQAFLFANKMVRVAQIRAEVGLLHKICQLGHLHLLKTITCF